MPKNNKLNYNFFEDFCSFEDESSEDDADLWFLPGPDCEEDLPPGASPFVKSDQTALFDPGKWGAAQNVLSDELARLTQLFGELDVRVRQNGEGVQQRLALREVADLSWWCGDRLSMDKLGLWLALRIGATDDTEHALMRAGWAVRRLSSGSFPDQGIAEFLDRHDVLNQTMENGTEDLMTVFESVQLLHPVTQAAILFHAWRILGARRSRDIEAAVLAARHGASMSRLRGKGILFLPLSTSGTIALRGQGEVESKLRAWISGAEQACLANLLLLDRLLAWKKTAIHLISDLSGRTPKQLVEVLVKYHLVSAPIAQAEINASRAAVQRNLGLFVQRGLVREVTGQSRYRLWTARL